MPEIVGDESVGDEVRDQRRAVGHLRRHAAARRDARGQGPVVGGGDLDQGGPGRRQDRRRADGARRVRDRRVRVQHRARVLVPAHAGPRRRPRRRGLQQDVRDRPPGRAVGVGPQRAALAVLRARARPGRRLLSRSPAGSGRSWYESNARPARGVRRPRHPARGRVGLPLVVADHQRRAPGDARPRRDDRPDARSRSSTSSARARCDVVQNVAMRQMDVDGRPRRLHAAAHAQRRLQAGPDDHAPRRRRASASSPAARTGCPT